MRLPVGNVGPIKCHKLKLAYIKNPSDSLFRFFPHMIPQIKVSLYEGAIRLSGDIVGPIFCHKLNLAHI